MSDSEGKMGECRTAEQGPSDAELEQRFMHGCEARGDAAWWALREILKLRTALVTSDRDARAYREANPPAGSSADKRLFSEWKERAEERGKALEAVVAHFDENFEWADCASEDAWIALRAKIRAALKGESPHPSPRAGGG